MIDVAQSAATFTLSATTPPTPAVKINKTNLRIPDPSYNKVENAVAAHVEVLIAQATFYKQFL